MKIDFSNWIFILLIVQINLYQSANGKKRSKRYVAFPDGSTWVMALCMTSKSIIPNQIFTESINWGIAYELPNGTALTRSYADRGVNRYALQRRHRRDLYNKFEIVLNSMGFDGRACIYRALCEASRRFRTTQSTLSEDIIRIFFKFPQQTISKFEPDEHRLYHWAYRRGVENKQQDCAEMFPACSISVIDLVLGYYNNYLEQSDGY